MKSQDGDAHVVRGDTGLGQTQGLIGGGEGLDLEDIVQGGVGQTLGGGRGGQEDEPQRQEDMIANLVMMMKEMVEEQEAHAQDRKVILGRSTQSRPEGKNVLPREVTAPQAASFNTQGRQDRFYLISMFMESQQMASWMKRCPTQNLTMR